MSIEEHSGHVRYLTELYGKDWENGAGGMAMRYEHAEEVFCRPKNPDSYTSLQELYRTKFHDDIPQFNLDLLCIMFGRNKEEKDALRKDFYDIGEERYQIKGERGSESFILAPRDISEFINDCVRYGYPLYWSSDIIDKYFK